MSLVLRDYQETAVRAVESLLLRRPILVAPTGSGKTVMGVSVARRAGGRCLWVAHRRELVQQATDSLRAAGALVGAEGCEDSGAGVVVRSVQALARAARLPAADLLVVDEAHHATAPTYRRLMNHYRRVMGLTATPFRLDGAGLGEAGFGALVVAAHTDELCASGHLIAPRVLGFPSEHLVALRARRGEFVSAEMADVMDRDPLIGNIVDTWVEHGGGARTVCFAVSVAHAEHVRSRFAAIGVAAEIVSGASTRKVRADVLERVRTGQTKVVVNCQVLTEGWDLPALEVAIMARPTASLGLYLQMMGRIMRASESKCGALVLDHAGNFNRHGDPRKRLVYSLDSAVREKTASTSPLIRDGDRIEVPAETRDSLVEVSSGTFVAGVRGSIVARPRRTCRLCLRPIEARTATYCPPCEWKVRRSRGVGRDTEDRTCPTCGTTFKAGPQPRKRERAGATLYCDVKCNPGHAAYRPVVACRAKETA